MNELTILNHNAVIELAHSSGSISIPKPFERDIFLFDTYIAGTNHIEDIEQIAEGMKEGDHLNLYREPKNRFDRKAIKVTTMNDQKIGYIPRVDNAVFSRLMDAGKMLFANVASINQNGSYVDIRIRIYMHE